MAPLRESETISDLFLKKNPSYRGAIDPCVIGLRFPGVQTVPSNRILNLAEHAFRFSGQAATIPWVNDSSDQFVGEYWRAHKIQMVLNLGRHLAYKSLLVVATEVHHLGLTL
jgi:hypothetical protein